MSVHRTLCFWAFVLISLLLPAVPPSAQASDPAEIAFIFAFGNDARKVDGTEETDDDARFARVLLREADSGRHADDLTVRLYEKAYTYGLRDQAGYQAAGQAVDKLIELDPDRALELGDLRLTLLEKWYADDAEGSGIDPEELIDLYMRLSREAAEAFDADRAEDYLKRANQFASRVRSPRKDEVREALVDLNRLRKVLDKIIEAEARLENDPSAANELALLYLAELDDPQAAMRYADRVGDAAFVAQLRLSATDFDLATPSGAREVGAFYLSLVEAKKTDNRVPMLIRAKVWLTEFLSRESGTREQIIGAHEMLGRVDIALARDGVGRKLARKMASRVRGGGQFDRPADVQAAIDQGVQWLYERRDAERHWEQETDTHRNWGGWTSLVVYALLMADEDPRTNRDLYRSTQFMMNTDLKGTYAVCFRIHAWEVLPQRERFRNTLTRDVTRLRQGLTRYGFWGYTLNGNGVDPDTRLDVSTTMAGGLGIWIGEEAGGINALPSDWERVARGLIAKQNDDGGWSYNPAIEQVSHGAMSAGATALLYAARPHLSDPTKKRTDEALKKANDWLDANFSPSTNVNRGRWNNYYLAAVQHAGIFSNRKDYRGMDWYESAAKHLVESQQGDGSWAGDLHETAFAIAFLCRGGIAYELTDENGDPIVADTVPGAQQD